MGIDRDTERALRDMLPAAISRDELARLYREARRRWMRDRRLWLKFGVVWLLMILLMVFTLMANPLARLGVPPRLASYVFFIVVSFVFFMGFMSLERPRIRRHFRQVARENGYELCLECGYLLRGLNVDVKNCPECGAKRAPMAHRASSTELRDA